MIALRVHRSERGVSLMEVLVALFILAVVGVAIIAGVFTSIKGTDLTSTRITAESLARTELEFVYSQPYATGWPPYTLASPSDHPTYPAGWDKAHTMPEGYTNYSITVSSDSALSGYSSSTEIQKITAVVKYGGINPPVYTIVTYQVKN
jgi:Tfp pilus assembly protein PilW